MNLTIDDPEVEEMVQHDLRKLHSDDLTKEERINLMAKLAGTLQAATKGYS